MADKSAIEWTDATWNPTVGCEIVSPGCTNCYAMRTAARLEAMGVGHYAGTTRSVKSHAVWTGRINAAPDHVLTQPLRWKRPRRIFVNSMSDLFAQGLPYAVIDRVFAVMASASQHMFQLLTKRQERMRAYCRGRDILDRICALQADLPRGYAAASVSWPLPNVCLMVSAEDQTRADERIPVLLDTPAAARGVSLEPLLGPIDLTRLNVPLGGAVSALTGHWRSWPLGESGGGAFLAMRETLPPLDWVIVGGESGPGARPMHPDWARRIRDDCAAAGVPFFFKQWGEWTPGENVTRQRGTVSVAQRAFTDGHWHFWDEELALNEGHEYDEGDLYRVGKRAAGRMLDGVTHDGFPPCPARR